MNKSGSSILCVIDFSEDSREALEAAVKIASSSNTPLAVLYPYRLNQPRNEPDVAQWKKTLVEDANIRFKNITGQLFKEQDVSWEFKPEVGFVKDRIEAYTQKNTVSMIVISSQLFLGSNDTLGSIVNKLKCPLMIIPSSSIS